MTPRRWHWQLASDGLVTQLRGQDRRILQLAVPAFFTLVVEPLFLAADSAIIWAPTSSQLLASPRRSC